MKELTRERVVPTISASISWLILGTTVSGTPCLPKRASKSKDPGESLFARIEKLIYQIFFVTDVPQYPACGPVK
jgi:hypothetical protein